MASQPIREKNMSLFKESSDKVVSKNISKLKEEGKEQKQTIAISLNVAGSPKKVAKPLKKPVKSIQDLRDISSSMSK